MRCLLLPSGKNIRKIHTIWYVIIPCPKMVWFHTIKLSFHTKLISFHTPWYVIIPTIAISYHTGIISYQYMSVHTVKVSFHTSTCHCILVLFHTKTCHFIPLGRLSYQQLSFHTIQVCHHTKLCHFIPMKCVWPSALYLRLLTTQPEITRYPLGYFFAMYYVAQCSCPPTEWLWLALTAPKCQASDALSAGI